MNFAFWPVSVTILVQNLVQNISGPSRKELPFRMFDNSYSMAIVGPQSLLKCVSRAYTTKNVISPECFVLLQ